MSLFLDGCYSLYFMAYKIGPVFVDEMISLSCVMPMCSHVTYDASLHLRDSRLIFLLSMIRYLSRVNKFKKALCVKSAQ